MFINRFNKVDIKPEADALYLSMSDNAPFFVNEAINHLCINVMAFKANGSKVFMMTSAGVREGKTVVSAGLARNLAKINDDQKILFVDADLRSTGITSYIIEKFGEQAGLSEYLSGQAQELNFIKTDLDNFDILCSGVKMKNPMALLASPRMKKFMDACKEKYDYIIIDSAPVGIVKDALLFAGYVDGYMISVKADKSKTNQINDAISVIKDINGKILGVVLTSYDKVKKKTIKNKDEAKEIARVYS